MAFRPRGVAARRPEDSDTERIPPPHENDCPAHHLQHLHDLRLVWPPEIPRRAALQSDRSELDDCVLRILLSSSRQPRRLVRIQRGPAKDDSGSDYAHCLRRILGAVFETAIALELFR